jgi:hypothetical protein
MTISVPWANDAWISNTGVGCDSRGVSHFFTIQELKLVPIPYQEYKEEQYPLPHTSISKEVHLMQSFIEFIA